MKIPFVGKSLWFMQNNNGVKQRFLDCFLKILDKKGCHAIPMPLPHSVKYILFNSGLPDNFHFIDEK
jgi:hypothetical protein